MGIFGDNSNAPAREFNTRVNDSAYGFPFVVVIGTAQAQQQLLWVDGFASKTAPSKGGGAGKGGGKSGEYLYSADVVAAVASGPILGLGDVWTGQSWLGNPNTTESYTISSASSYTYTPVNATTFYNDFGVAAQITYSGSFNDFGAPSSTSLSGTDNVPMKLVPWFVSGTAYTAGQTVFNGTDVYTCILSNIGEALSNATYWTNSGSGLTTGQYSINPSNAGYNFSSADNTKTVLIGYSYLVRYINQQQTDIVPSGKSISVGDEGSGAFVYSDEGVTYFTTGAAFTKVSGTPIVTGTYSTSGTNPMVYKFATGDINTQVVLTWQEYDPNIISPGQATSLNYTLNNGGAGQEPFSYLTSVYPDAALAYPGVACVLYQPMDLGMSNEVQENRFEVITPDIYGAGIQDCNPVQCIGRVLTDGKWGLGVGTIPFPVASIDNGSSGTWGGPASVPGQRTTASTAWNWFAAQSFFISPVLDSQDTAASTISKWLEAGMCSAFISEGLLKLVPYGDTSAAGNGVTWEAPSAFIVALDDTCFIEQKDDDPVKISRISAHDAWNVVQVQWDNRLNQYSSEVTQESDQGLINRWGERREDPQDWNFIHTVKAATFAANLRIKHNAYVRNTYEFTLPFTYSYLEPMDIVTITTSSIWAAGLNNVNLGIDNLPVRITKIVDDPQKGLSITCEDYLFGAHQPTLYNKQIATGIPIVNAFADPGNAEVVMFEATDRLTLQQGDQIWIGALGTSSLWGSCNIWVSQDGSNYECVGAISTPARLGELASTFASGSDPDTTHSLVVDLVENCGTLTAGTSTDADSGNTLCFVDGEIIAYSALTYTNQNQITCGTYIRRGQMGSTISSHSTGGLFMRLDSAVFKYTYDPTWRGQTLSFKFQSVNAFGNAAQALSGLTPVSFTLPGTNMGSIDAETGIVINLGAQLYLGLWNSSTAYIGGNQVSYGGALYQCVLANTNEVPATAATYWVLLSVPASVSGYQVLSNPSFQNGLTKYTVYDNNSTGHVSLSLSSNTSAPGGYGEVMEISVAASGESPGLGGFYYPLVVDGGVIEQDTFHVGDIYNVTVWASIPVGYTLNFANNSLGTGGSVTPLSASYAGQAPTPNWQSYSWQVVIGTSPAGGAVFPFFYLTGTFSTAFSWYVAQLSVVDISQQSLSATNAARFVGNWSSTVQYVPQNQVIDAAGGGGYYIATAASLNKQPSAQPSFWTLVTPGNVNSFEGTYSGSTAYTIGQIVEYQGSQYVCVTAGTGNTPSPSSGDWTLLGSNGLFMGTWNSSTAYTQNMSIVYQGNSYVAIQASTNENPATATAYWSLEGPDSLDNLEDGTVYIKGTAYSSSVIVIQNSNFEASATVLPPPGWVAYDGGTIAYITSGQQSGTQSVSLGPNTLASYITAQKYSCQPGDQIFIGGYAKSDGTAIPSILLFWFDGTGTLLGDEGNTFTTSTSWNFMSSVVQAPSGSVYFCPAIRMQQGSSATAYFDNIFALKAVDPTSQIIALGSTPNTTGGSLTYESTSSSIDIIWAGLTLFRADGSTTVIPDGSQTITGLSASTTYYFYPFWSESLQSVEFVDAAIVPGLVSVTGVEFTTATAGYVSTTTSSTPNTSSGSIEFWVNFTASGNGVFVNHCNAQTGSPTTDNLFVGANAGNIQFGTRASGGAITPVINSSLTYNDGRWHHVVCTWSTTAGAIYVDGVSAGGGTIASESFVSGYWRISSNDTPSLHDEVLGETISNVAVYNGTTLSSIIIEQDYQAMVAGSQSTYETVVLGNAGLTYFWKLTETSGTSAADSKSTNTGTYQLTFSLNQSSDIAPIIGTPAYAWEIQSYAVAQVQGLQSNVPLSAGAMALATVSVITGSGGGQSGGAGGGKHYL